MSRFNPGDRALINSQVATIISYDENLNWFQASLKNAGSTEIVSGHISNTNFQPLDDAVAAAVDQAFRQDDTRDGVTNVGETDPEVPDSNAHPKHKRQ